jgi:hypothetical protein
LLILVTILAGAGGASPPPQWIYYDDGTPYHPLYRENAGDGWAIKVEPAEAGYIQRIRVYVGNPSGNTSWEGFRVEIWDWNPSIYPETPKSRVWGPENFTYDHGEWVTYRDVDYYWNSTDPFVVLLKQRGDYPNCDTVFGDTARTDPNPNWSYFNQTWFPFELVDGDFLMRVYYGPSHPAVEPMSFGRVRALYR